jgi:hypothetical protein
MRPHPRRKARGKVSPSQVTSSTGFSCGVAFRTSTPVKPHVVETVTLGASSRMAHMPVQEASVHRSPMCHLCLALAMHHHVWHSTRAIHVIAVQVCRFELAPPAAKSTSLSSHDRSCLIRKFVAAAGKALPPPPPPPPPAAPIAPPASQVSPHSAGAQFNARVDATHTHPCLLCALLCKTASA